MPHVPVSTLINTLLCKRDIPCSINHVSFVWMMPPTTLKLKQRLAALSPTQSTAHDSSRSPAGTWSPATARRKFFNNTSWMKSPTSPTNHAPEFTDLEVVQEVLSRMIFQAGVDFEWDSSIFIMGCAECWICLEHDQCKRTSRISCLILAFTGITGWY